MILMGCGLRREGGASRHKGRMRLGYACAFLAVKVSQRGLGGTRICQNVFLQEFWTLASLAIVVTRQLVIYVFFEEENPKRNREVAVIASAEPKPGSQA